MSQSRPSSCAAARAVASPTLRSRAISWTPSCAPPRHRLQRDVHVEIDPYLIVNAVEGLAPGAYVYHRGGNTLELLEQGDFRREAAYLDLGQPLAGDAAFNAYWLVNLDALDDRAYRAAQLFAAIEAGQLYLSAYGESLGATGLTFFDDDVTRFFSPHAQGKAVLFLTAVGHPVKRG